jgi:hypothetical protein
LKFLSAKKSCSPAVQTNSVPQSTQLSSLSWNSIGPYLSELAPHLLRVATVLAASFERRPALFHRTAS